MIRDIDVAFSFAGEDRIIVEELAKQLISKQVKVFYDEFVKADLWGKDLYQYLSETYYSRAKFCLVFISSNYIKKLWTNHELKSAQARAFSQNSEYILPIRLDDTVVPGILPTLGFVDLRTHSIEEVVDLILFKLGLSKGGYLSSIPLISNYPETVIPIHLLNSIKNFINENMRITKHTLLDIDRAFNLVSRLIPHEIKLVFIEHELISPENNYLTDKGLNIFLRVSLEGSREEISSDIYDRSKYEQIAERIIEAPIKNKVRHELLEAIYAKDTFLFPVIVDVLYSESSINLAKKYNPELSYEKDIRNNLMSAFDLEYLSTHKAKELYSFINSNVDSIPDSTLINFFQEYYLIQNNEMTVEGFISIYEAVNEMDT